MSRQEKASQGEQDRLMLIARHEEMLAAFMFSLTLEWICQCIAQQVTLKKQLKSEGFSGGA